MRADNLRHAVTYRFGVKFFVNRILEYADKIGRIAHLNGFLRAEIQRQRCGYHDQNHGGKNADVRKTYGVAVHAVQHPGHADEVASFIIEAFVLSQRLEYNYAHRRKQAVGADDDENHGDEIYCNRAHRVLGFYC